MSDVSREAQDKFCSIFDSGEASALRDGIHKLRTNIPPDHPRRAERLERMNALWHKLDDLDRIR